jgi:4-hydroxy-tetrahydrodipicolinate synthase
VVPYYNKPTQEGLYRHFKAIAEAVDLPMILYNVPGRTVADMSNETVLRLAQVPGIAGLKDATASMERATDLILRAPKDFALYSGDDASALAFILMGGHGTISVTANVAPGLMHQMCVAALEGKAIQARQINARLFGLHRHLFHRGQPDSREVGVQPDGPDGRRHPAAPDSLVRAAPRPRAASHARSRRGRLNQH